MAYVCPASFGCEISSPENARSRGAPLAPAAVMPRLLNMEMVTSSIAMFVGCCRSMA
jgi:hypothetical protein